MGVCGLLASGRLLAQDWSQYYDDKLWHLIFVVGPSYPSARISTPANFPLTNPAFPGVTLNHVESSGGLGVQGGIGVNLKLHRYFDLRTFLILSLQQRNFKFYFDSGTQTRRIESTNIEIPLYLRYKSQVYYNRRVYLITGPKFSYNWSPQDRAQTEFSILKASTSDLSWSLGAGFTFYGDKSVFSPEIVYSFGLRNVYAGSEFQEIPNAIQSIYTSSLAINFIIE